MPKEIHLQSKILKALAGHGGWWREISASLYQSSGLPDIIGTYKGVFIAFEVKRPNQKYGATLVQQLIIGQINDAGGVAMVIESVEEALNVLRQLDG